MADDNNINGATTSASSPPPPVESSPVPPLAAPAEPAVSSTPSPVTTPVSEAVAGVSSAQAQVQQQAANEFLSIRDAAKQYGYQDIASLPDDQSALQQLLLARAQAQQNEPLLRYGQEYMQHAGQFQQWRQQQEAAEAAARAEKEKLTNPFGVPEYDPRWANMVVKDPNTGEYRPVPGAPPDVVQKLANYGMAREEAFHKLLSDPYGTLAPVIEHFATKKAEELIQKQLGGYKDTVAAEQFVQQNASWMYSQTPDPRGQRSLSPEGQLFAEYVRQGANRGLSSVQAQQEYALGMLQRDLAMARLRSLEAPAQGQVEKDKFVQAAAARQPNQSGSLPNAGVPAAQQQSQNPASSFADRLRHAFSANGVTDKDFQ